MKAPISISTGLVYRLTEDFNERIDMLKKFQPDGVEINFAHPQYVLDFKLSPTNEKFLKSLKFVTIHAPWREISWGKDDLSLAVLKALNELYLKIGAKNINFHVPITDFNQLTKYDFQASIENDDYKAATPAKSVDELDDILKNNDKLKFVFDFAHALTVYPEEIPRFLSELGDKICAIHISYLDKKMKDHGFLSQQNDRKLDELTKLVVASGKPLIIESVASNKTEVELVRQELKFLREKQNNEKDEQNRSIYRKIK